MSIRFPVYKPFFTGKERELILECIDSTWISSKGRFVGEFERNFASYLGVRYALTASSGTTALHVALEALGIGPGDEVLVPTLTYIASANAVTYTGANVVFVDSEEKYWQISIKEAERKINEKTKAIMPVHLYGHPCDMDSVIRLAKKYSLLVVEDCAEAIGSRYKGKLVGTFGDVAAFSFFGNKTITTGEGGMVVTNNPDYAEHANRIKGQGLAKNREYWHDVVGYNYRMTNICAAIGCAQLEGIEDILSKKQKISAWYMEMLKGSPLEVHGKHRDAFHSYWMISILVQNSGIRDSLRVHLNECGVETRPLFYPIHEMKMYKVDAASFPVAESISGRGVTLPSYPGLTRDNVAEICKYIKEFYDKSTKSSY